MKDFAPPVELMKRALGFAVTAVKLEHLCCVGLSDSSNLVQSFGNALNVDSWLYYRSYPLKRSLNKNTEIPNVCPL